MEPTNIRLLKRGADRAGNYRLLDEPALLKVRVEHVPSSEELAWEDDGGPSIPLVVETTTEEYNRQKMRLRGARKQRAARAYRPTESIRVVKEKVAAPPEVVGVRLRGGSDADEQIAALEARVKALLGIVRAPIEAKKRKDEAIEKLAKLFNVDRKVRAVE